jgi:predicted esterase
MPSLVRPSFALLIGCCWITSACGSNAPQKITSGVAAWCALEGESCPCDDDSEGVVICDQENEEMLCECEDNSSAEEDPPKKDAGKKDAGAVKDAGQKDAAVKDAGRKDAAVPASETDAGGGAEEGPPATGGSEPRIPAKPATCPEIKTGTITVNGQQVQLQVGAKVPGKKGPILFYWHGTGSSALEASGGLGKGNSDIIAQGGVLAAFTTTTRKGQNTGNNVWYTGDFEMADQILACAIEQRDIDPRRVYTAGCSAGGLQASAMVYSRSSYLAAAMPNSGGTTFRYALEDPKHIPTVIATHGAAGRDVVVIDFSTTTATMARDISAKGGFMVVCDHGGGHCGSPAAVKSAQWDFLMAHPFGVTPEPYADGLPAGFPSVCKIIAK